MLDLNRWVASLSVATQTFALVLCSEKSVGVYGPMLKIYLSGCVWIYVVEKLGVLTSKMESSGYSVLCDDFILQML